MNAMELFKANGESVERWYCGKCGVINISKDHAEACCDFRTCKCGKKVEEKYYLECKSCRIESSIAKEKERFDKAEKLTDYDGPVFLEGFPHNNGYAESLSEMIELWEDNEDEPFPEYVWACDENQFVQVSVADITERFCDDAYEDWEPNSLDGLEELKVALQKFCDANVKQVAWDADYKRAVIVPKN